MTLPDKLSDLLELALKDLRKHIDNGGRIDMAEWLLYIDNTCYACLAGAVLKESLKHKYTVDMSMFGISHDVRAKMVALNYLRRGHISMAAHVLGLTTKVIDRSLPHWRGDDPSWWEAQYQTVKDLRDAGE
jgi:hypothetical protein